MLGKCFLLMPYRQDQLAAARLKRSPALHQGHANVGYMSGRPQSMSETGSPGRIYSPRAVRVQAQRAGTRQAVNKSQPRHHLLSHFKYRHASPAQALRPRATVHSFLRQRAASPTSNYHPSVPSERRARDQRGPERPTSAPLCTAPPRQGVPPPPTFTQATPQGGSQANCQAAEPGCRARKSSTPAPHRPSPHRQPAPQSRPRANAHHHHHWPDVGGGEHIPPGAAGAAAADHQRH